MAPKGAGGYIYHIDIYIYVYGRRFREASPVYPTLKLGNPFRCVRAWRGEAVRVREGELLPQRWGCRWEVVPRVALVAEGLGAIAAAMHVGFN